MYADDHQIYHTGRDQSIVTSKLKDSTDLATKWYDSNLLAGNLKKYQIMNIGYSTGSPSSVFLRFILRLICEVGYCRPSSNENRPEDLALEQRLPVCPGFFCHALGRRSLRTVLWIINLIGKSFHGFNGLRRVMVYPISLWLSEILVGFAFQEKTAVICSTQPKMASLVSLLPISSYD